MITRWLPALLGTAASFAFGAEEMVELESTDSRTIEVEILDVEDASVTVRRADGNEFKIGFDRLTEDSVEKVREIMEAREASKPVIRDPGPENPLSPEEIAEKLTVKRGEKVAAIFTITADGLARPESAEEAPEDRPRFSVDFKAGADPVMAVVRSTFDRTLQVRCLARDQGSDRWYLTSILPLRDGLPCYESWADPVEELVFFDFEFVEEERE